jgi:hypothetical protein
MRAIETDITVAPDGRAVVELQLPASVSAGKHRAVVVLGEGEEDYPGGPVKQQPVDIPVHDFGPWPANISLRREDLYGDHGR